MFSEVNQGTKHPEAGLSHNCTLLSLVTLGIFLKGLYLLAEDKCSLEVYIIFFKNISLICLFYSLFAYIKGCQQGSSMFRLIVF